MRAGANHPFCLSMVRANPTEGQLALDVKGILARLKDGQAPFAMEYWKYAEVAESMFV